MQNLELKHTYWANWVSNSIKGLFIPAFCVLLGLGQPFASMFLLSMVIVTVVDGRREREEKKMFFFSFF